MGTHKKTPTGTSGQKRSRPCDVTDSDSECDVVVDNSWPRFLVIEGHENNNALSKLSPFAISKGLQGLVGTTNNVRRLREGQVLVEVDKRVYSDILLRSTQLAGVPIRVSPHKFLNVTKGIMRCPDLRDCSLEEIQENLQSQMVSDVKRIMVTRDGERKPTNTYILTFNLPKLPNAVKVGYLNVPLEVYVPNPLRCFKCQQFGHHKDKCRKKDQVCAKCGKTDHTETDCCQPLHCVNCQGSHAAFSKDCPKWLEEKEVQRMKHTLGISYPEARKRIQSTQQQNDSYASVVKQVKKITTSTVSIQTELTWPLASPTPKQLQPNTTSNRQSNAACQTTKADGDKDHGQQRITCDSQRPRSLSRGTESSKCDNKLSSDREEDMDTGTVPKPRPCPLSKKNNKGGGKKPPPK